MTLSGRDRRVRTPVWCLVLVILTAVVYGRVYFFDFVNYDDDLFVTSNPQVQAGLTWEGVQWAFSSTLAFWIPLTRLSHMLDCELFGLNPAGHHLSNLILHLLNAVLLFLVLKRMTGAFWRSALVAALFAVHPLNVETVAWVAERKGLLCTLFWLLGLGAYARYAERPGKGAYAAVLLFFVLALMAKPMAVTFPLTLIIMDFWPLNRHAFPPEGLSGARASGTGHVTLWRLLMEKVPFLALSAGASLLAVHAEKVIGALQATTALTLALRVGNALVAWSAYLGKAAVPIHLAVFYPFPDQLPVWKVLAAGLFLAVVTAVLWRSRTEKPYLLAGWVWYLITLLPVIGLIKVGAFSMADRYAYVPLIGVFAAGVWWGADLVKGHRRWRSLGGVAMAGVAGILGITAQAQTRHWMNGEALFSHAIRVTGRNALAHNNLGMALFDRGDRPGAVGHFRKALAITPGYLTAQRNLGGALASTGRYGEVEEVFREILKAEPDDAETWSNLGLVLAFTGRLDEGEACLARALSLRPRYARGHFNLAMVLSRLGRFQEAEAHYRTALRLRPDDAKAHNNLGAVLRRQGKVNEARRHFEASLRLDPGCQEARRNLERLR